MCNKNKIDTSICDTEWSDEEHEEAVDALMEKSETTDERDCDCVWPERCSLCR